ncbi:MAG: AbrB/MazE/SpoVT family DNA-binding domain-containing protein [Candidatus Nitrosocosmicus sp.]|nr:AbrB/MazE/SpoVT family DNA-binding domain-containing protein [Candidatus Nitrosocosmicus sp.]MDN5866009.1 AbrB/MazE/SpoVT family DNA-binding domain-containing protein [Candidatus Nitrosocosmicus sp.]
MTSSTTIQPMSYQKVLSGRRISLPDQLTKKYGIKEGDFVIVEDDDGIKITPAQIVKRRP